MNRSACSWGGTTTTSGCSSFRGLARAADAAASRSILVSAAAVRGNAAALAQVAPDSREAAPDSPAAAPDFPAAGWAAPPAAGLPRLEVLAAPVLEVRAHRYRGVLPAHRDAVRLTSVPAMRPRASSLRLRTPRPSLQSEASKPAHP